MTKAKAARAQLPGQSSDAEPLAADTPVDTPVEPVHDEAGAPPPADPPVDPVLPEPRLPPLLADFTSLELVRSLPEVTGDIETQPVEFAAGSIQRFKASDTDRRTLEVIALPGMGFAARAVTTEEA